MRSILIISNDYGGTNAVLPIARTLIERNFRVWIISSGNGLQVWIDAEFQDILEELDDSIEITEVIKKIKELTPDAIVTGAGAYNQIEHTFRLAAAELKIFCFAQLDYWSNYQVRFRRKSGDKIVYSFPDLIGMLDSICLEEMIAEGCDEKKLIIVGAPNIEESVNYIQSIKQSQIEKWREEIGIQKNLLTVVYFSQTMTTTEPKIDNNNPEEYVFRPWGFTQLTILRELISSISKVCNIREMSVKLIVKAHPRESYEALSEVLTSTETSPLLDCMVVENYDAKKLICISDIVTSTFSTTLIEAALSDKPALSIQIGRNQSNPHYSFWGNRVGATIPIFDNRELQQFFDNYATAPKSLYLSKISFENSASNVADLIQDNLPN